MNEVAWALKEAGFFVSHTSYGRHSIWAFLLRSKKLEQEALRRLEEDIRDANTLHNPDEISIIAHSFGTYIFSKILQVKPDYPWKRIIFCGSVLRDDFPFGKIIGHFHAPLLNEVGGRDIWPALAEKVGYGAAGTYGFNRPAVETRFHNNLHHSDFLTAKFCTENWVPFIRGDELRKGDTPLPPTPWHRKRAVLFFALIVMIVAGSIIAYRLIPPLDYAEGFLPPRSITSREDIRKIQRALCVEPQDERIGARGSPTRVAIDNYLSAQDYLSAPSGTPTRTPGQSVVNSELNRLVNMSSSSKGCREEGFQGAFEVGLFQAGTSAEDTIKRQDRIKEFQLLLQTFADSRGIRVSLNQTGNFDPATRTTIREIRRILEKDVSLDQQLDHRLHQELVAGVCAPFITETAALEKKLVELKVKHAQELKGNNIVKPGDGPIASAIKNESDSLQARLAQIKTTVEKVRC